MKKKTHKEILISQYNDQLELILSRQAQIRTLKNLDPKKIVEVRVNPGTGSPVQITAQDMIDKSMEKLELDQIWLKEIEEMIKESNDKSN